MGVARALRAAQAILIAFPPGDEARVVRPLRETGKTWASGLADGDPKDGSGRAPAPTAAHHRSSELRFELTPAASGPDPRGRKSARIGREGKRRDGRTVDRPGDSSSERPTPETSKRRLRDQGQLDFEIGFLGRLLERDPYFVDALRAKASTLAAKGQGRGGCS